MRGIDAKTGCPPDQYLFSDFKENAEPPSLAVASIAGDAGARSDAGRGLSKASPLHLGPLRCPPLRQGSALVALLSGPRCRGGCLTTRGPATCHIFAALISQPPHAYKLPPPPLQIPPPKKLPALRLDGVSAYSACCIALFQCSRPDADHGAPRHYRHLRG